MLEQTYRSAKGLLRGDDVAMIPPSLMALLPPSYLSSCCSLTGRARARGATRSLAKPSISTRSGKAVEPRYVGVRGS